MKASLPDRNQSIDPPIAYLATMKRPNLLSLCSILCGYASTIAHAGTVAYAGINIAGFDFGCKPNGTCFRASMSDPGQDGIDQMIHFGSKDRLNVFRMPVAWQYLVKDRLGGKLDEANFGEYDKLVQGCLYAGAKMCIIDIHNYGKLPKSPSSSQLHSRLTTAKLVGMA